MLAQQWETAALVFEIRRRFKARCRMTAGAIFGKGVLVRIFVAAAAFLIQAEIGELLLPELPILYECGFMTLFAIYAGMFTREFISRFRVVETLLVKPYDLEIPAVMIAVTGGAVL